jgi:1-acyl-sn-glycerol-3-phosphate acyltransferase/nucleoside-diphosphate-sugar epimerase
MTVEQISVVGHIGTLARAAAESLRGRGHSVSLLDIRQSVDKAPTGNPTRILYLPFPPGMGRKSVERKSQDLDSLRSILEWAVSSGVGRFVLRSHAVAYGISMKNPGLLDEGRNSLLPKGSLDRRWLEAEEAVFAAAGARARQDISAAAVRLVTILDPEEGDPVMRMLLGRMTFSMAGYDPQLQFLSLSDAAECLACAVCSDARGVFNGSGPGTVPAKAALRASVPLRVPINGALQKPFRTLLWKSGAADIPGEALDRVKYNWTVSPEKAAKELGFRARQTSSQALREFLKVRGRGTPGRIKDEYDEFGLNPEYIARLRWWFNFLCKVYWRVEVEGLENIPSEAPALLAANHRGFMPFDGVVHRNTILQAKNRHIRFLVIPSLFKFPFLSDFLVRQGGVVASQTNTQKLFARRDLVGVFPEGISGAFRMYKGAYRLGDMSRNHFAKMAIENGVPIIPSATIGHVEIFPILFKVRSSLVVQVTGWPFLPITPTFPLLPVPLPTKWHIRYLEPVPVSGYAVADAADPKAVNDLAARVVSVMQRNIDEMLSRRKHIFFGNIFDRPEDQARRIQPGVTRQ